MNNSVTDRLNKSTTFQIALLASIIYIVSIPLVCLGWLPTNAFSAITILTGSAWSFYTAKEVVRHHDEIKNGVLNIYDRDQKRIPDSYKKEA